MWLKVALDKVGTTSTLLIPGHGDKALHGATTLEYMYSSAHKTWNTHSQALSPSTEGAIRLRLFNLVVVIASYKSFFSF